MICAVGKNSCRARPDRDSGMPQEAPMCRAHDLFPKQQRAQKCEKSLKGSRWWGGGDNGGSPQSKQVGLKPACPSFQPLRCRDKRQANVETEQIENQPVTPIQQCGSCQTYPNQTENRPLGWRPQSSVTGNSNKCLKLHSSHNLPRHRVITNQLVIWRLLFFLHMITREITRRHDRDICLCVPGVLSPLPRSIYKSLRLYCN